MATYDVTNETSTKDFTSILKANDIIECNYSGSERSIILPNGIYIFECYGAQGGNSKGAYTGTTLGGKGAKVVGTIKFNTTTPTVLYLSSGQQGILGNSTRAGTGGWNGGGSCATEGHYGGGGGGATHIATHSGLLKNLSNYTNSILMVAGAGGGASLMERSTNVYAAGGAGGQNGEDGKRGRVGTVSSTLPMGGTQTAGGAGGAFSGVVGGNGSFGLGGDADHTTSNSETAGAGGAGYYGGGSGLSTVITSSRYEIQSGAGGSSYTDPQFTNVSYTTGDNSGNGSITITAIQIGLVPLIYIKPGKIIVPSDADITDLTNCTWYGNQQFEPNTNKLIGNFNINFVSGDVSYSSFKTKLCYDLNNDEQINYDDVQYLTDVVAKLHREDIETMDINMDGVINNKDVIRLNSYVGSYNPDREDTLIYYDDTIVYNANPDVDGIPRTNWKNDMYREIQILDGEDASNRELITWFRTNGTLEYEPICKLSELYCQIPALGIKQVKEAYIKQNGVIHKLQ